MLMRIDIEIVYAFGIEGGSAPLEAMHLVALGEKKARKISAILPGYTRYQRGFLSHNNAFLLFCNTDGPIQLRALTAHEHHGRVANPERLVDALHRGARAVTPRTVSRRFNFREPS